MDRHSIGSLIGRNNINSPKRRMSIAQSLRRQSSALSVSGRSNQSVQVICRSAAHVVESFGSSLPVLVTEALTFVDRNAAVSWSVSHNGWAWLVCGRRLLVWQCKTTIHDPKQRSTAATATLKNQCRELSLPQSDLAHKANCIAVWLQPGHQVPSCMAVSPEGTGRYWPSVAHEELSVETSAELAGQEVDSLTHIPGHGCILATTTCTVALLQPQLVNGRHSITCRVLRTSQGWLGGIGRRMSSLIFGAMPQAPVMETKLAKVTCTNFGDCGSRVLILAGSSLQYWSFPANTLGSSAESEKLEFDEDIGQLVSQRFQKQVWSQKVCNPQNIDTWSIDMQSCDEGIILLVAAHCSDGWSLIDFAVCMLPLNGTKLVRSFKWFIPLKMGLARDQNVESTISSWHLISSGWEAIIYDSETLLVVDITNGKNQDFIKLIASDEDKILGGDLCSGTPVLFTRNLGLVTVSPTDFTAQDFINSSQYSLSELDISSSGTGAGAASNISNEQIRELYYTSDGVEQLKAAFLFSIRQNKTECEKILFELFPLQEEDPVMDIDASLDTLVLQVAKKLIDDYPPNDPRWASHVNTSSMTMTTVMSMQISHQLEGKQRAFDLYINFLKEYSLWDRFCAVTYRGIIMSTFHVLGEYAEKIVAAMAIFNLQNRYPDILDSAIEQTLAAAPEAIPYNDGLTAKDVFYRKVSVIHLLLPTLINSTAAQVAVQSEKPAQQISQYILQVNSILLDILHEVIKYRSSNAEIFASMHQIAASEYLPWTAAVGKQDLRSSLYTMQDLTLKHGVTGTNDVAIRRQLYDQVFGIIDLILDGQKCHLESIRGTEKFDILHKQYEAERSKLLQPLVSNEQYDSATMLAEKYYDFATLVQICELTNNTSRLDSYSIKFAAQNFVDFLFSYYVKDGRQGQLVERCRRGGGVGPGGTEELLEKISQHPELSWVQFSLNNEFRLAAETLHSLGRHEVDHVKRKKTILSLSKLAFHCVNEPANETVDRINNELYLIAHQEELPVALLETYGYDTTKIRVLTPFELITLNTCEENTLAYELDFKKALDLLDHVSDDSDKTSLRLKIWARAAKRDSWDTVSNNPEQQIEQMLFFKLISQIHNDGDSIDDFLPPVESLLLEPELGTLATSSNFQFLIKLIYEYAAQNFKLTQN